MPRLAVTGHRPTKLFKTDPYSMQKYLVLLYFATDCLRRYQAARPDSELLVITGMALGWDMAIAEASESLGIPYHAYLPCLGQENVWHNSQVVAKYKYLVKQATHVHVVSERYTPTCMQDRNEAMVDHCDELMALWDGSPGGTWNCVQYAQNHWSMINIIPVWDLWVDWKATHGID